MEKLKRIKLRTVNNDNDENQQLENSHTERDVTFDKFRKFLLHSKTTRSKKSDVEFGSATVDCTVKDENSLLKNEFDRNRSQTSFLRQSFHSLQNSIRVKCGQQLRRSLSKNKRISTDNNNNNGNDENNNENKQKSNWNSTDANNNDDSIRCNHFLRAHNNCRCDGEHVVNPR